MLKTDFQIDIQEWANANEPGDEMIYKKGYWSQILFVRDNMPDIFSIYINDYKNIRKNIKVISTHVSKSIKLPVFLVEIEDLGLKFILRNNFHDWKVTVISEQKIDVDFDDLITDSGDINSLYCEGFQHSWVYPHYTNNQQTFTVEIVDNFKLFTFFWLIKKSFC